MLISKRAFMVGVAATAALSVAPAVADDDGPGDLRVRRDFNDPLAKADVAALAKGLNLMRKRKDSLSLEKQRLIHAGHYNQHGSWRFFPWHRAQLAHFESIIARLSGKKNFALPYWDAQDDEFLPDILLTPGSAFYIAGRTATAATDYAKDRWNFSLEGASIADDDFDNFVGKPDVAGRAEGYGHNSVHMITGGKMGDIETAPLDPLFWLHHCNVDRVWATWQRHHYDDPPEQWQNEVIEGFVDARGKAVPRTTARTLLDIKELGYGYFEDFSGPVFAAPPLPGGAERPKSFEIVGQDHYHVSADMCGQSRKLQLRFPDKATDTIRNPGEEVVFIEGKGVVRYATQDLARRVITVTGSATARGSDSAQPERSQTLGSAPAFFHSDQGTDRSSDAMPMKGYAQAYGFRGEIQRLIDSTLGPVTLSCDTIPLDGPDTGNAPVAIGFDLELTITRRNWV